MKAFTDVEESKKLAEILPIDSADMGWNVFVDDSVRCLPINDWDLNKDGSNGVKFIPAWSLAALLDILRDRAYSIDEDANVILSSYKTVEWDLSISNSGLEAVTKSDPIDACVEMILKLPEQKLL